MCLPFSVNFGHRLDQYSDQNGRWRLVGATKNEPVFSIAAFSFTVQKINFLLYYIIIFGTQIWDPNPRFEQTCCGIFDLDGNGLRGDPDLVPKLDGLLHVLGPKSDPFHDLDGNELRPDPVWGQKLDGLLQDLDQKSAKIRLSSSSVVNF